MGTAKQIRRGGPSLAAVAHPKAVWFRAVEPQKRPAVAHPLWRERLVDLLSTRASLSRVTPADALADIRGYASASRIRVVGHAQQRMRQRGVTFQDLRHALTNAATCTPAKDDRWRVEGPDAVGDEVTAIVAFEDSVIVVTVF